MSSKINLSDIETICNFIVFKIKTSNYLNFLKENEKKQKFIDQNLQFIYC